MNTSNGKNVLVTVVVAIISSLLTIWGFNAIQKNNSSQNNGELTVHEKNIDESANSFGQDPNVKLTSLTTSDGFPDFTEVAEKTVHGVVHIKSISIREQQMVNPFDFFFGFGGEGYSQPQEQVGFGSGVIISKDGYIITNNHVIEGAHEVSVTLNDKREFTAKVIGTDPKTDIALIKIEGNDFPYIPFGNSEALKVGEWVLAVGNPFNLTSTVTAGIVSAKNRGNLGNDSGIQSFIQIDAAVNRGNSGGALVNTKGELVGINTMIYSTTGDFNGLAFAVPISIAGKVTADLKQFGMVQRAVLGIQVENIEVVRQRDPEKAKKLSQIKGVAISEFVDRSPAKAAGMEKGDIITAINNNSITDFAELQTQLSKYRPGDKVKVNVQRDGKDKTFTVELKNELGNTEITKSVDAIGNLGATFAPLTNQQKQEMGISSGIKVESVTNDGLFRKEGINKGFVIMRINNSPVNNEADVSRIVITAANSQDKVILVAGFYPNQRTQYIAIDLSKK